MIAIIKTYPAVSAMLVSAVLLCAAAAFLPAAPVWITDNGNKYIIMRNFAETGKLEIAHSVPGNFPAGGFHFKKTEAGYRSFYPEQFPVFVSYLYRMAGERVITLIPLLCGILLAGTVAAMLRSFTAAMLTLFATPCAFYSLLLWEMIPAVLAGFCGIMLLRKKSFFSGGLLLGLGLFLREEMYFLGAAAGLVLLFEKEWRAAGKFAAGAIAGALPVWLVQYLLTGHILGVHGSTYYLNNRAGFDIKEEISGIFWNYFHHLFRFENAPLLIVPVILLLLLAAIRSEKKTQTVKVFVLLGCTLLFCIGALRFDTQSNVCFTGTVCAGFIATFPVGWIFWSSWKKMLFAGRWQNRFLTGVVIAYTLLVPPLLTRHDVGLFWGARHFLFIVPFVIWLALRSLRFLPYRKYLLWGLAAVSVFWQFCGFAALAGVSEESEAFTRAVLANSTSVVASDVFFLPEQAPQLFFQRRFCEVTNEKQLKSLLGYMKKNNLKEFVFVTSARWTRLASGTRRMLLEKTVSGKIFQFESGVSGFMDLVIFQLFLRK